MSASGDSEALAVLDRLSVGYRGTAGRRRDGEPRIVLAGVSEAMHEGELVCLLGPNGSGKSTLLKTIAGFQAPLAGELRIAGRAIGGLTLRERAREVSVVLTERVDSGMLTGYELVALGRYPYTAWMGGLSAEDDRVIRRSIQAVKADHLAGRSVSTLSDGERQRIMIARALAQEPRLLLLDEPTAFLDLPRRVEIMALLRSLSRGEGRAVLLATHELELALQVADRIWLITPEATIEVGAPEDLILQGAFERSFPAEGLEFDRRRGSFRVVRGSGRRVGLSGEGIALHWTKHALAREGFSSESADTRETELSVRVEGNEGCYLWTIDRAGRRQSVGSMYELVRVLRTFIGPLEQK